MSWRASKDAAIGGNTTGLTTRPADVAGSVTSATASYFPSNVAASGFMESFPQGSAWDLGKSKEREMPDVTEIIERWTFSRNLSQLSTVLPYKHQDKLRFEFWRTTFLPSLATRQAERSRPRSVQSKTTRVRAFMERFSIGFEMTYADATTPGGELRYKNGLLQMKDAMNETINIYILEELSTCDSPWRTVAQRFGSMRGKNLREMMDNERFFFCIFQRIENAWQLLDTTVTAIQAKFNGKGNTYITHEKLKQYTTQVGDRQVNYDKGGPDAIARVDAGPDAVTTDGRGNLILTVDTYNIEGARALDLLKRYITLGGFNEFRNLRRGGNMQNYFDKETWCTIYDVDRDRWTVIDTEYIINNCARFDPTTGTPYGINSAFIKNRHTAIYDGDDHRDSYHYTVKLSNGKEILMPAELMGNISGEYITIDDVFQFAEGAIIKMVDINKLYSAGLQKTIVEGGFAALRAIEQQPFNADGVAFLRAASSNYRELENVNSGNQFNALLPISTLRQEDGASWKLPDLSEGDAAIATPLAGPIGYGNAGGFEQIAEAVAATPVAADFEAKHRVRFNVAEKATAFIGFLKDVVSSLSTFMPDNIALDPSAAAPWYTKPTALTTLWDNVIVPHARFPYLFRVTDGPAMSAGENSGAVVSGLRQRSSQSTRYLNGQLLGNIAIMAHGDDAAVAARVENIQAAIEVRNVADTDEYELRYSGTQGQATDLTEAAALFAALPKFARDALGSSAALGNNNRVRLVSDKHVVAKAFNTLITLIYGTINSGAGVAARETVRAMILGILNMVRIDLNDSKGTATRILNVYNKFIGPRLGKTAEQLAASTPAQLLNLITQFDVAAFKNSITLETLKASADDLFFTTDAERSQFVALQDELAGLRVVGNQLVASDDVYAASPLVYSPAQLATIVNAEQGLFSDNDIGFADILMPSVRMTAAIRRQQVQKINSRARDLPSPLRPLNYRLETPSSGIQISYLNRLLQSHAKALNDGASATTRAAVRDVQSNSVSPMSADGDLASIPLAEKKKRTRETSSVAAATPAVGRGAGASGRFAHIHSRVSDILGQENFAANWEAVEQQTSRGTLAQWVAKIYLMSPFNGQILKSWSRHNLLVPVSALLFRWARLGTYSIIKVLRGESTGHTNWGNGMFTWCNDSFNRMYYSEYSLYIKPKVEEFANVMHIDNVFSDEYLGGWGTKPFGFSDGTTSVYTANEANTNMPSVFVSLEPFNHRTYDGMISATGYKADIFGPTGAEMAGAHNLDFDNALYFNTVTGIQERVRNEAVSEATTSGIGAFEAGSSPVLAYREPTGYWNPVDQDYTSIMEGDGMFPTEMYGKGFKDMLNGKLMKAPKHAYKTLTR